MYSTLYARADMVISNPKLGLNGKIHTPMASKKRSFRAALNTHFEMEVPPPPAVSVLTAFFAQRTDNTMRMQIVIFMKGFLIPLT